MNNGIVKEEKRAKTIGYYGKLWKTIKKLYGFNVCFTILYFLFVKFEVTEEAQLFLWDSHGHSLLSCRYLSDRSSCSNRNEAAVAAEIAGSRNLIITPSSKTFIITGHSRRWRDQIKAVYHRQTIMH